MSAQILDGKLLAAQLKKQLKDVIEELHKDNKKVSVVSITVGNDPSTFSYLKSQKKAAEDLGIRYKEINFPITSRQDEVLNLINQIDQDSSIHGVIINKPLPAHIEDSILINRLDASKDIEGLGERNQGRLLLGKSSILPCTAAAALELLRFSGVVLKGKQAVVIGRSEIVGKPMALLLLKEDVTVTICHSKTENLPAMIQRADIVVAAIGKPLFVKGDWLKPGAIVIDVGINQQDGKIVGDVDFESCKEKASFITPVPGGVGPVTSVMLMKNVVEAFKNIL
ncbi:MAG: bifunctional 5,10-methylenetetrahydrofolate dehydrogenase/5,10-methenyltetrahydrofolate cyclohydrolase [Candidatus Omnitrophica bacterium]|nr:bifunctional 5,10-methylenetetrahydrofolate dehydrogenase/5,10-methenyltetrahydrofolate cyclohydrolase [Candidatus Omnitrophota bacterium]